MHTFVGQGVVVVLPRELGGGKALGGERLQGLDDLQVGHGDVGVLRQVIVFLSDQHALLEQIGVDLLAVLFGDDHNVKGLKSMKNKSRVRRFNSSAFATVAALRMKIARYQ